MGQTSLYQFSVTAAFWLLLRYRKSVSAGLISAFLLVKLQYMPILLLIGAILGRWKYCLALLASSSVLTLITLKILGWNNIVSYPQSLIYGETSSAVNGVAAAAMQNLRGEMVLWLGDGSGIVHLLTVGSFAAGLFLAAFLWLKAYPRLETILGKNGFGVMAAVSILVSLIFSPHTHTQDYLTATIALIFLYPFIQSLPSSRSRAALSVLCLGFPVLSWIFYMLMFVFQLVKIQPFFFWAAAVLLLTAGVLRKSLGTSASPNLAC
jgi:hypothetical protein